MQRSGYIRWIISLIICFSVFLYNIYGILKPLYKTSVLMNVPASGGVILEEKTEQETAVTESQEETVTSEITETQSEPQSAQSTSSIQVSAKEVKGNIISKYISPYTAPSSYSKVYMKNSSGAQIDIKSLLNANLSFKIDTASSAPQVLIVHTHATESFMSEDVGYYTSDFNSRNQDNSKNMVKIGEIVAEKLNSFGIATIHDKTQHDYPEYTGSYSRAATSIKSYLKKYPQIKVVLDLHRDSVSSGNDKTKLVTEINNKKAAQVMLVMGSQTGSVTNHPDWKENLKLAFRLQQKMEEKYPTLARPLMLASKRYNQNLTKGSLLIEFGTDANTLEEASYSAELVANALSEVLKEE